MPFKLVTKSLRNFNETVNQILVCCFSWNKLFCSD